MVARVQLELRNYDQASAAATLAFALEPAQADALDVLGRVHKSGGDLQSAEACYALAIRSRPDDANFLSSRGIIQRQLGPTLYRFFSRDFTSPHTVASIRQARFDISYRTGNADRSALPRPSAGDERLGRFYDTWTGVRLKGLLESLHAA